MADEQPGENDCFVLLKLKPPTEPIYIVVRGYRSPGETAASLNERHPYFYEEHTCPTNFLGVDCVISGDDTDPHDLFEHVKSVVVPGTYGALDQPSVEEIEAVFGVKLDRTSDSNDSKEAPNG